MERIIEAFRTGDSSRIQAARDEIVRAWKDIDVRPLLALKEQLAKLGLDKRASHLEEALITVAEKRPGPFLRIADEPDDPLWRPAIRVLSMAGDAELFKALVVQAETSPRKALPDIIDALGRYGDRAARALSSFLKSEDDEVFYSAVLALREAGSRGKRYLEEALAEYATSDSERAGIIKSVIGEKRRDTA